MRPVAMLAFLAVVSSPAVAQSTFHGNVARSGAYAGAGPAQARSCGAHWNTKQLGDLRRRQALELEEHEHFPQVLF